MADDHDGVRVARCVRLPLARLLACGFNRLDGRETTTRQHTRAEEKSKNYGLDI